MTEQNWSSVRKTVNFTLACFYALMTFVLLDIGSVVWVNVNEELGISYKDLNYSWAIDCAGLALGCIFLYPLAVKFGRRPVYILSLIVQLAGAIWFAHMQSNWENMVINFIIGLAGAISETIVQMTIADLFFTHQRASANAMYFFVVTIGTFLAPVAAGYCAASQGWRWIWWWCVILLAVNLIAVLVFFEETKYIPVLPGSPVSSPSSDVGVFAAEEGKKVLASDECTIDLHRHNSIVADITKKSDVQRLALITKSNGPLFRYSYQPVIVLTKFPAAALTALIYGANLAWYSVCGTTAATYLVYDPYDFGSIGVGLFSLAPFIGSLLAALYSGPLADFYIVWASKRNGGVFEPEMRLHLALLAVLLTPLGLLLYGLPLANVFRRLISPFVYAFKPTLNNADQCSLARAYRGLFLLSAVYGFAFSMIADLSLTYLLDCYQDVSLASENRWLRTRIESHLTDMRHFVGRRRCSGRCRVCAQRHCHCRCLCPNTLDRRPRLIQLLCHYDLLGRCLDSAHHSYDLVR